jgi:beta-N-acetylhexosaminidase
MKNHNYEDFKKYFQNLSPYEQAGYFLWPSLAGPQLTNREIELFKICQPSGVILFKRNLSSMSEGKHLIENMKKNLNSNHANYEKKFIVAIDEEGGRVSRLPVDNIRGKPALYFCDQRDELGLHEQVQRQCDAARELGVNCLLAPVADILTEPNNPVMGDRCFGRNAEEVFHYANIVFETIDSQNLKSCAKHFPGHGNTLTDSHKEISVSHVTLENLRQREWVPFKRLIEKGIPFIMVAHVLVPQVDPCFPATLSSIFLQEY